MNSKHHVTFNTRIPIHIVPSRNSSYWVEDSPPGPPLEMYVSATRTMWLQHPPTVDTTYSDDRCWEAIVRKIRIIDPIWSEHHFSLHRSKGVSYEVTCDVLEPDTYDTLEPIKVYFRYDLDQELTEVVQIDGKELDYFLKRVSNWGWFLNRRLIQNMGYRPWNDRKAVDHAIDLVQKSVEESGVGLHRETIRGLSSLLCEGPIPKEQINWERLAQTKKDWFPNKYAKQELTNLGLLWKDFNFIDTVWLIVREVWGIKSEGQEPSESLQRVADFYAQSKKMGLIDFTSPDL